MASIVILGGGFAGWNAAVAARRVVGASADVTMISRDRWLTIRPRLYKANPETLRIDLLELLQKVKVDYLIGNAVDIDLITKSVVIEDARHVKFDRLVIATGSIMARPPIPGVATAFSIDNYADAVRLDRRLARIAKRESLTIAIIGAGFTGLELALEMRDRIAAHAGLEASEKARIILVERSPNVGAELGDEIRGPIEKALSDARIEVRLNTNIVAITADSVTFSDSSSERTDASIVCTGLVANSLSMESVKKDRQRRLMVDEYLRVPDHPSVFGAGDAALAQAAAGRFTYFSCQHALQTGKIAGENAALELLGRPLRPYSHEKYVTCLDLGRSGAVFTEGWDRKMRSVGQTAKSIKLRINTQLIYPTVGSEEEILAASQVEN